MIRPSRTLTLLCFSLAPACTALDGQDEPTHEDAAEIADTFIDASPDGAAEPECTELCGVAAPGEVLATKTRSLDGRTYTFKKVVGRDGTPAQVILDSEGREIAESALPRGRVGKVSGDLRAAIDASDPRRPIQVRVALIDAPDADKGPAQWGEAIVDGNGVSRVTMNGVAVTEAEILTANEVKYARIVAMRERALARSRASLREISGLGRHIADQPDMAEALAHGRGSVSLGLEAGDVEVLLRRFDHLIAGIELESPPADELAAAMLDTGIDPHALNGSSLGNGIGIYMSEGSCPGTNHITDYTRINTNSGNPSLSHPENVSAIIRGTAPDAHVYCRSGYTMPTAADLNGYNGNPRIHIETHSWGEAAGSSEYRINDRDFDNHVYNDAVAVFKSAGNLSPENPSCNVSAPGKALNLTTIGNYDDSTDTINSSSCHIDSEIGNVKPEISAPGTNITAGGWTLTGTSMASPHAAGFAADLLSNFGWLQLRPAHLKSEMLVGSVKSVSGSTDKVGVGGLDFHRAFYDGVSQWWEGDNASFSYFDSTDHAPNNGKIDYAVHLDAGLGNVRVAVAWLNRGSFTYDHRADAHPIGMDLDMCVYDPYGVEVACSSSWDNPYELVSFDPTVTGFYQIRVSRYANRDTSSKLHMAVSVDW